MSGTEMPAGQSGGSNASEFVSPPLPYSHAHTARLTTSPGAKTLPVRLESRTVDSIHFVADQKFSMLEDPSHQDVARWGKDGDTFVVVEVR